MKKELQVLGAFNDKGVFEPTQLFITDEVATHELNHHLNLSIGSFAPIEKGCNCPDATPDGFYQCVGSNCVFVPY